MMIMLERIRDILTVIVQILGWTWLIVIAIAIIWGALMYIRAAVAREVIAQNKTLRTLDRDANETL